MLESKQHLQWTSLQYLQVPVHDCTCSDFVANSYTVWWVPFSDRPLQSIGYPFSDLAFRQKLYYHYFDLSANKTIISSNPFRIRICLFLSYSFGTETINTFIHSCSSLENHTWFQTKMGKLYTRFQTKGRKNPTWWGGTYLYSLYKGVPHPHPSRDRLQKAWTNQLMKRPVDMTTSIALSIKINY